MTAADGTALLLACVALVGPTSLGVLVGVLLARVVQGKFAWIVSAVLSLATLVAIPVVARALPRVSSWDVVLAGLLFVTGLLVGTARPRKPRVLIAMVLLSLVVGELVASFVPAAPVTRSSTPVRFTFDATNRDAACERIFPRSESTTPLGTKPDATLGTVLSIGDSMVEGLGVTPAESVVGQLNRREQARAGGPTLRHVNLGASGAGPDAYLMTLRHWLPVAHPRAVVVSVFVGNDLSDLGRNYLCCDPGPLLDDAPGFEPRCSEARWFFPFGVLLATSPAPFPFRALAPASSLASLVVPAFRVLSGWVHERALFGARVQEAQALGAAERDQVSVLQALLARLATESRNAGVPLLLVVLPHRPTIHRALGLAVVGVDSQGESGRALHEAVVTAAKASGAPVLDLFEAVKDGVREAGADAFFAHNYPGDVHFSALGNERFAAEVARALEPLLSESPQPSP